MNQVSSAIQPDRLQDNSRLAGRLSAYLALSKARLSLLVLMTTATGFVTATLATGAALTSTFAWTLLGTFLAAASANAFNGNLCSIGGCITYPLVLYLGFYDPSHPL